MFFDTILLNTQHGGRFGIAWIVATRGIGFVMKRQIKELDIIKLCDDLQLFIITHSTSPKKRFSLRLSSILINGIVKIFNQQAKIVLGDLYTIMSTIHIPTGYGSLSVLDSGVGIMETPPIPVPKVKTKRGKKVPISDTPELKIKEMADIFLQLPSIKDILLPPARTEDITIREELHKSSKLLEDDFGLGVLSGKEAEEELQSLLSKNKDAPKIHSQYPSSESAVASQYLLEVVAQVHAPKDDIGAEDKHLKPPTGEAECLHIENDKSVPVVDSFAIEVLPPLEGERSETEARKRTGITEAEAPTLDMAVSDHIPQVETELVKLTTKVTKPKIAKKAEQRPILEKQLEKVVPKTVQSTEGTMKLLLGRTRKLFVRINRCNENEGKFFNEKCPLPSPYKNILCENLYDIFWFEEMENIAQVRASTSVRSLSLGDSIGLRKTDGQRYTLERESVPAVPVRPSMISVETPIQESTPGSKRGTEDIIKQVSIEEPSVPVPTLQKRRRVTINEDEQIQQIPEQPTVSEPPLVFEQPALAEQQIISEHGFFIPRTIETEVKEQLLPEEIISAPLDQRKGSVECPSSIDYKIRQQKIVNIVIHWDTEQSILTIEDICEKPINKLNIAKAFSDLLSLQNMELENVAQLIENFWFGGYRQGKMLMYTTA